MDALVYDIETRCPVLGKNDKPWPNVSYASSWTDFIGMGIACVCAFDFRERRYRVFDMNSLPAFRELARGRHTVVGFNIRAFDEPLLAAHGVHYEVPELVDLIKLFQYRVSLDKVARANGLPGKDKQDGIMAPIRWQQGRVAEVVDYCLEDVRLTAQLYQKWARDGYLIDPRTGRANVSVSKHIELLYKRRGRLIGARKQGRITPQAYDEAVQELDRTIAQLTKENNQ